MGCSVDSQDHGFVELDGIDSGIMAGHAYSIIDVFEVKYNEQELKLIAANEKTPNYHNNHRLVRIRNPWGYGEWTMKWSEHPDYRKLVDSHMDSIRKYYIKETERFRNELNREPPEPYEPQKEGEVGDGTFLMCYKDWRKLFGNLFMCINFPDSFSGIYIIYIYIYIRKENLRRMGG